MTDTQFDTNMRSAFRLTDFYKRYLSADKFPLLSGRVRRARSLFVNRYFQKLKFFQPSNMKLLTPKILFFYFASTNNFVVEKRRVEFC